MAVLTHLETDTGTNVDISGATAVGAYTANGDKLIMVDVSIDAVAGNGGYVMYVTRQIGGSGSAYRILPQTTMAAASGLTAISGQSGWITVRNGDVLTCYVDGLAGDTSTPDWTTRWFESAVTLVTLADDAITAAKFDESTAFPLKSADTGSTAVARVGADSDTLETLSDEIAGVKAETAAILADTGTDGVKIASAQTVATVTNLTNLPSIPANWITAAGVATGAIDADAIASNAITSAKIATGAITNAKFASGAIDAAAIATDAIGSAEISAAAVTKIQNGLATPTNITAGTITTVTNLTNLPTMPTDWLTAAGLKADAVSEIQAGVTLASSQPAITWGRQKIIADVVGEGALHIVNTNGNGFGQKNIGGAAGVVNEGDVAVVNNGVGYGMYNSGNTGMYNIGSTAGMHNTGNAAGMHNYSASTGGAGMRNEAQGASGIGIRNIGTARNVVGYDPDQATEATLAAIKAKTDNLPASPAAVGSAMTLTAAYDKAKDDVLTPLGVVDGIVDAIKVQTDKIPASPASAGEYTANIGAIKAKTDNLPLSPASSGEYTSALTAIQSDLDNPNQYKADVSNLALEATLTAIKGTGWTDETLAGIMAAITAGFGGDDLGAVLNALEAIKGAGWTNQTLAKIVADIAAISAGGATAQEVWEYATRVLTAGTNIDLSALATAADLATLDGKVDTVDGILDDLHDTDIPAIKAETAAIKAKTDLIPASPAEAGEYTAAIDAVDAKVSAIDTDTVMSFMIDGFTFEQIVQIMASVLAGKLTRSGDTLTFRDLADTVNRVVAETDANKQRTTMTYTV